jgi:lipopolysaccharide/colanic/teichoic acid biosynthesis glycosyltransferase
VKRLFDVTLVLITAPIWVPILILIAVFVRLKLGAPVFFTQIRPGLSGKPFRLVKFRSMTNAHDAAGAPLPDSERLPAFGRLLRSTSLDELPELFNVLKADMSLVGPRPLLMEYLPLYSKEQARRHEMRPGLTGWAQVNGRNALSWEEKFKLDIWYIENQSFLLDLRILLLTIVKVMRSEDVSSEGSVTMERFRG